MTEGARQLPTMHISVRVPWHDNRWDGTICRDPRGNTSCLALQHIADQKNDDYEATVAGTLWNFHGVALPPCANERGAFMADFEYSRRVRPPNQRQGVYKHFKETVFTHPRYSLAPIPFGWVRKESDGIPERAKRYNITFNRDVEPAGDSPFVQTRQNQLALLDTFFGAIKAEESLVFCYAQQTPLADDQRRVIVGVGRVLEVHHHVEYDYQNDTPKHHHSILFERNIRHSVRPVIGDGFLLPYHELLDLSQVDASVDLQRLLLSVPDECQNAFSMGAEHVTNDQAIGVLLSCLPLIAEFEKTTSGNWAQARTWVDSQLNLLWKLRGPFPGLASVLTAFGFDYGALIEHQLLESSKPAVLHDMWDKVEQLLYDPTILSTNLRHLGRKWNALGSERKALVKLLSRFDITSTQARRWFVPEERRKAGIELSDGEILANPYLCFEVGRKNEDAIPLRTIDRGIFPSDMIGPASPVPQPSACTDPTDFRRARALCLFSLDAAASKGDTLLPQDRLVRSVRSIAVAPKCELDGDAIATYELNFEERLCKVRMHDGGGAWQLRELALMRDLITNQVIRGLAVSHAGDHDWYALIDKQLSAKADSPEHQISGLARDEKARALKEIFRSGFSVLIGPAGSGKTTLLQALLDVPGILEHGVLSLAPTGKARVRMQQATNQVRAYTLAQFLRRFRRYNPESRCYVATGSSQRERRFRTIIIDEASMLTEEQLGAAFDAIDHSVIRRVILVGDPGQLPPIGPGRPFVDILRQLRERILSDPHSTGGLAELTVNHRQTRGKVNKGNVERDDVLFASVFGEWATEPDVDAVLERLEDNKASGIRTVQWDTFLDLQEKLLHWIERVVRSLADSAGATDCDLETAFEISLGGRRTNSGVNLELGAAKHAECWQILTPRRVSDAGVWGLNRWLQRLFRKRARGLASDKDWLRKVYEPLGPQRIVYGDKVISCRNGLRTDVSPQKEDCDLANGEIGIVIGQHKDNLPPKTRPAKAEVEFSSQLGFKYGFSERDFSKGEDSPLELAYALTIHKAQGSEFRYTFVILPNSVPLSRELIYTALTRHREYLVLFHQGHLHSLMTRSSDECSETARRLTNLFAKPNPVKIGGTFLEDGLIHVTARGESVRSKSEVIIANLLYAMNLWYEYERPFFGDSSRAKYPDFTCRKNKTDNRTVLIEHLGRMDDASYRRRWEAKLAWYRSQGVQLATESGSSPVTLVVTDETNGIDSARIKAHIQHALTP